MKDLIPRVKAILLTPGTEWVAIGRESGETSVLFARYVAILGLVPALASLIGASLVGGYRAIFVGLLVALFAYVATFAAVYGLALIVDALAPRFGATKNYPNALKLSVYSATPLWLAGIFLVIPGLSFMSVFGLYGVYLLWTGVPLLMPTPPETSPSYALTVAACAIAAVAVVGLCEVALLSALQ